MLDALDIKKEHVRIPVFQTFLNPDEGVSAVVTAASETVKIVDPTAVAVSDYKPYAVSKCIKATNIGPHSRTERLEVLGFVVGDDPGNASQLPDAMNRLSGDVSDASISKDYSGIHYLGGLYDSSNRKLAHMRKSAVVDDDMQTMYMAGQTPGESLTTAELAAGKIYTHTHKDWPSTLAEQCIHLNENPMADALYYHKTQIRFLLTGIDDIAANPAGNNMDQSSNHRGTVRMLVLRPRTPAVRESLTTAELAAGKIYTHTHKDWPSTLAEQCIHLNENPMADALYYHKTQIRFLLTGIDDIAANPAGNNMDQSSNHRGTVRMLVLRPRTPAVRTRVDGTNGQFTLNHDFMPNWDTQLFYDRGKQLGGKLDITSFPHTTNSKTYGGMFPTGGTTVGVLQPDTASMYSSDVVTYGLKYAENPSRHVDKDSTSQTFGHQKPSTVLPAGTAGATESNMIEHQLTSTDLLMSKVNKQKFAVLHDEVFTLDSLHHGAASQHIANVSIPYNKKVRFAGRVQEGYTDSLSYRTNDAPMNMTSRPIILFLSYNQKISASVEGFTAISEC